MSLSAICLAYVRRHALDVNNEAQLISSVQVADEAYIKAVTEATTNWKSTVDELGAQVMPLLHLLILKTIAIIKTNCKSPIFSLKYIVS